MYVRNSRIYRGIVTLARRCGHGKVAKKRQRCSSAYAFERLSRRSFATPEKTATLRLTTSRKGEVHDY